MKSSGDQLGREVWPVAVVVVLGSIGSVFATTSVNVAIELLTHELDTDVDTVQWIASGYLLGLAASISATGWLARRVGARRVYLVSLVAFAAASVLCAVAPTIEWLIAFRVVQGVAGGATMPVGMMMLATAAGPQRMGRVMSVVGVPMILGPVVGPTLTGILIDGLSWHWVFLMNVPLALAAFVLGVRLLPQMPAREAGRFDLRGFLLMAAGAPMLVYGLARCGQIGTMFDPVGLGAALLGAGLVAGFAWHAWRTARAAARRAAVEQAGVCRVRGGGAAGQRDAVWLDAAAAAFVSGRPRRLGDELGAAADPAGHRRGARARGRRPAV